MAETRTSDVAQRTFDAATASIGPTRRFVRSHVARVTTDSERIGDIELATSELVTNAVEHGEDQPVTVAVSATRDAVVVSVTSSRSTRSVGDPATWTGPLRANRSGRGLPIVRALSDHVSVDVGEATLTVSCEFHLTP